MRFWPPSWTPVCRRFTRPVRRRTRSGLTVSDRGRGSHGRKRRRRNRPGYEPFGDHPWCHPVRFKAVWFSNTLLGETGFDLLAYSEPGLEKRVNHKMQADWTASMTSTATVGKTTARRPGLRSPNCSHFSQRSGSVPFGPCVPVVRRTLSGRPGIGGRQQPADFLGFPVGEPAGPPSATRFSLTTNADEPPVRSPGLPLPPSV